MLGFLVTAYFAVYVFNIRELFDSILTVIYGGFICSPIGVFVRIWVERNNDDVKTELQHGIGFILIILLPLFITFQLML